MRVPWTKGMTFTEPSIPPSGQTALAQIYAYAIRLRQASSGKFPKTSPCIQAPDPTHAVGSTGLSLQHSCWRAHLIESVHNLKVQAQAVDRALWVGNPSEIVWVYEYYVANTFDDRVFWYISVWQPRRNCCRVSKSHSAGNVVRSQASVCP